MYGVSQNYEHALLNVQWKNIDKLVEHFSNYYKFIHISEIGFVVGWRGQLQHS